MLVRLGPRAHRHSAAHGRRLRIICPARSTGRPSSASNPKKDKEEKRKPDLEGAVLRPGLQDRRRHARRTVLHPHLLGHAQAATAASGTHVRETKEFASKIYHVHRRPAQGTRRGSAGAVRRRHRRYHRPEGFDHGRHAVRSAAPDRARSRFNSPRRSSVSRSSRSPAADKDKLTIGLGRAPARGSDLSRARSTKTPARR